ncbi:MAG: hypothetical protein KF892_24090 [Rhizobacter sp.]|nr:hypothetical protein [Rhizobacter sp.]
MEWPEYYDRWSEALPKPGPGAHLAMEEARRRVQRNTTTDWEWLSSALGDAKRKRFVALLFQRQPVPKRLLNAFILAGVLEQNPSLNRMYIEPCVRSWGGGEINRRLLRYLREGTNEEKAGAASAFYWATSNPRDEDLSELRDEIRSELLREFVENPETRVLQRIIPLLNLDAKAHPEMNRPLIKEAISIARAHPDEYIRHRVEIQLGVGGLFRPIPAAGSE